MGSGQSVAVQEHLNKWENALHSLEELAASNQRAAEQDRIYGSGAEVSIVATASTTAVGAGAGAAPAERNVSSAGGGRRPSSLVAINDANTDGGNNNNIGESGSSLGRPRSSNQATPESRQVDGGKTAAFGASAATPADGSINGAAAQRHTRQQILEIKKARVALFRSYESEQPSQLTGVMQCGHFGAAAVALSYLMGGHKGDPDRRRRVTLEDIFFAAQVPLFMLHTGAPHLPTMADILREFLDVDNRFKGDYALEELHLDISPTTGQVELGLNEVGDRQTRMSLPDFCHAITQDCEEETNIIRIVNYDPYVLEQEMLIDAFEDEDEHRTSALATSVLGNPLLTAGAAGQRGGAAGGPGGHAHSPNNDGAYAAIVDVRNAVQLMVTIAEGIVNDSLHVKLTEVPAAALFKAMMTAEDGHRARGFIRVFKKDAVPDMTRDDIEVFWTPELCSGKVLGTVQEGTHASAVSHHISPHIVVVAWAMHLLGGTRPGTHGYGCGLPVSDIIAKMRFPAEVFINGSASLDQVYEYAAEYLARSGRDYTLRLYPVLTKISREDAVPTISVFDLEKILLDVKAHNDDPEAPAHVMAIMYNASVAHNVLYIADAPQWCVLAGYDPETQTALLIDAHPKTFSRTWTCALDRLHMAVTGSGYMVFSKTPEPVVGAPATMVPMVQQRLDLLQAQLQTKNALHFGEHSPIRSFRFPSLPLMPTMVALACTRVGIFTTFEDVVQAFPHSITSLMNRVFTLEGLAVCFDRYIAHRQLRRQLIVATHHGELEGGGGSLTLEAFRAMLAAAARDATTSALVVHFDPEQLVVNGAAHPFGTLGLVVGYDAAADTVVVTDCNPNSYARTWGVAVPRLLRAVTDTPRTHAHRARGCLLLTRGDGVEAAGPFPPEHTRDYTLELLPVQNLFHVSPSAHFQAMSLAFAMLGHFYSPEEIFYEAYLKTKTDQRLRGSQAYAWRDVDVSLSVINTDIDAGFMAQVCAKFLESRAAHRNSAANLRQAAAAADAAAAGTVAVERLEDVDTEEAVHELLSEATAAGSESVLLLNYDTTKVCGAPGISRSAAMVRAYDPETHRVELWDAEYAVFGLSRIVTTRQILEMGDLENVGHSPFGFVRFTRVKGGAAGGRKKKVLMQAPGSDEEEEPTVQRGDTHFNV